MGRSFRVAAAGGVVACVFDARCSGLCLTSREGTATRGTRCGVRRTGRIGAKRTGQERRQRAAEKRVLNFRQVTGPLEQGA
jgi:hypothetical protein